IKVSAAGIPLRLDGNGVVKILRQLQRQNLTPDQKAMLQDVHFSLDVDGDPVQVNAAEVVEAWRRFQGSKIPEQLLRISEPVVPSGEGINPRYSYVLLFILVLIV